MSGPLLCGFSKLRNEIIRAGGVYRLVDQLLKTCDVSVVCDDASVDGTSQYLHKIARQFPDRLIVLDVPPARQRFEDEQLWKQLMLERVHRIAPKWIFWLDGDETLDRKGTHGLRTWLQSAGSDMNGYAFHYTQLWRTTDHARTDSGFDDGWYIKLWRHSPDLKFDTSVRATHHHQFPVQVLDWIKGGSIGLAPFQIVHWGNMGVNLRWKAIQYWGGLGGVPRHLEFTDAAHFAPVPDEILPEMYERRPGIPREFLPGQVARTKRLRNLRKLPQTFCVVVPTFNRGRFLRRALDSLLLQTWDDWIAVVLDDGSSDDTPDVMWEYQERDPRIFYARYPSNQGGVAMNEIGMAIACETAEWWTRLGSDDYFFPHKLELDAWALQRAPAVYGPYQVEREGQLEELCNIPLAPEEAQSWLLEQGRFCVSWANCAVETRVLEEVRARFGSFCHPGLRNMEDFLVNARIAAVAPWHWRGKVGAGRVLVRTKAEAAKYQHLGETTVGDAIWRCATDGASGDGSTTNNDHELTMELIRDMAEKGAT